ncbi:MAG: Bug family tripartite tricarboxylate transporter substrate binding protein [Candidatus Rokuibacteriota bacterium]
MKMKSLQGIAALAIVPIALVGGAAAWATGFPTKPVTVIVPWKAGGAAGLQAQELAQFLGPRLGQRILVSFKPGGASEAGALFVKNATPDGHTLLQAWIATFVQLPITKQKLGYDSFRDFDYLAYAGGNPVVLLVRDDRPWKSVADYVEHVRSTPGHTHTFSGGPAISLHSLFCGALFRSAGVAVKGVFYQGSGAALPDLLGGNIEVSCHFFEALRRFPGQLRALAVFSKERVPGFERVPTVTEQGLKAPTVLSWSGYVAPAGLPADVRGALVEALRASLTDPGYIKRMRENHDTVVDYQGPEQFKRLVKDDLEVLRPLLEQALRAR